MPYDQIRRHRQLVSLIFLWVSVLLGIGWPISAYVNLQDILQTPARLAYLISDYCLALPLCILSYCGLQREARWAPPVSLLAMGALAYDTLHFGIFLIGVRFLNLPAIVYILLMVAILFVLFRLAFWEIRLARQTPAPL